MANIGSSDQLSASKVPAHDDSEMKYLYFSYTHSSGAGTGEVSLGNLPSGKIRVYPELSRCTTSAFAAGSDIHLGHTGYTEPGGTAVAADDNAWVDNGDAATGGNMTFVTGEPIEYNSESGIAVEAMIDTGNIEDTDTIAGYLCYTCVGV